MAKSNISITVQELVRRRANGCCEYCLVPASFSPDTFPFDHILPLSLGGTSTEDNLALADGGCNGHKYNKTRHYDPLTNQLSRLFNPRIDDWKAHFRWSEDETLMIGITPIGRATVELLQVNRESNINLRRLLISAGLHPPKD
ncbi:MAG: HNH endonuclease [Saprospiraceae bacterium]|nr:HNH endonuclease [Saprospiraceae bacterium]